MKRLVGLLAVAAFMGFAGVASAEDLGAEGQIVVSHDIEFGAVGPSSPGIAIGHQWQHRGTTFAIQPAFDYFLMENLSLGGAIALDNARWAGGSFGAGSWGHHDGGKRKLGIGVGVRVGYTIPVGPLVFWPKAGIELYHKSDFDFLTFDIVAPFTYSPAEHFFIGIGPKFSVQLTENDNTNLGLVSTIGGYF